MDIFYSSNLAPNDPAATTSTLLRKSSKAATNHSIINNNNINNNTIRLKTSRQQGPQTTPQPSFTFTFINEQRKKRSLKENNSGVSGDSEIALANLPGVLTRLIYLQSVRSVQAPSVSLSFLDWLQQLEPLDAELCAPFQSHQEAVEREQLRHALNHMIRPLEESTTSALDPDEDDLEGGGGGGESGGRDAKSTGSKLKNLLSGTFRLSKKSSKSGGNKGSKGNDTASLLSLSSTWSKASSTARTISKTNNDTSTSAIDNKNGGTLKRWMANATIKLKGKQLDLIQPIEESETSNEVTLLEEEQTTTSRKKTTTVKECDLLLQELVLEERKKAKRSVKILVRLLGLDPSPGASGALFLDPESPFFLLVRVSITGGGTDNTTGLLPNESRPTTQHLNQHQIVSKFFSFEEFIQGEACFDEEALVFDLPYYNKGPTTEVNANVSLRLFQCLPASPVLGKFGGDPMDEDYFNNGGGGGASISEMFRKSGSSQHQQPGNTLQRVKEGYGGTVRKQQEDNWLQILLDQKKGEDSLTNNVNNGNQKSNGQFHQKRPFDPNQIALLIRQSELLSKIDFEFPITSTSTAKTAPPSNAEASPSSNGILNGILQLMKKKRRQNIQHNAVNGDEELARLELQMGIYQQTEQEQILNNEALVAIENQRLAQGFLTIYSNCIPSANDAGNVAPIQVWKRHWFVLLGFKLKVFDFEYQESNQINNKGPLMGEIDLSKLTASSLATRDRICTPNTIQLQVSGLGKIFVMADDAASCAYWKEKFESLLKLLASCNSSN